MVFVFHRDADGNAKEIRVWVCKSTHEEDVIEDRIGPVEPGRSVLWSVDRQASPDIFTTIESERTSCRLRAEEIPAAWRTGFPSGIDIIRKAIDLRPAKGLDVDTRIVKRRLCEYEVFLSLEESIELPLIRKGFQNIDEFVARAQTILQRRKARSGRSLELQLREILREEGFVEGATFSHQPESDPGKRPDFLFPSESAYKNPAFAKNSLRMLAVKTTCKDRWRQILNEADRVKTKHLLTLQEGVSENQFKEMIDANVKLVVPRGLHDSYPASIRPALLSLDAFLGEMKKLP